MKNVENETKTQLDLEYGEKHCKRVKMRNSHGSTWNMARNTENEQKWVTHTVGRRIWQETVNNIKNEKCKLSYLVYGYKNAKCGKCDKHTVGPGIWRDK